MHVYAIGLGSNRRHGRHGDPRGVVRAAMAALAMHGRVTARSAVLDTAALGPGGRRFANAAVLIETRLDPPTLLAALKGIEQGFGRRSGRRWGARVIDLDILLWSGGGWASARPRLVIPHRAMAGRRFVLDPLAQIAPDWPVPRAGARVRHLAARLTSPAPFHRSRPRSGP